MSAGDTVRLENQLIASLREIDPDIVKRGFKIFEKGDVKEQGFDEDMGAYIMLVKSQSNSRNGYVVDLGVEDEEPEHYCTCPYYNGNGECKHIAAAIIKLISKFVKAGNIHDVVFTQIDNSSGTNVINHKHKANEWFQFLSIPTQVFQNVYRMSGYLLYSAKTVNGITLLNENISQPELQFQYNETKKTIYYPEVRYDRENAFSYKCTCTFLGQLCPHVKSAFDWIQQIKGSQYFLSLKDFSKEKTVLLKPYGLTLDDEETKQITFYLELGVLKMNAPEWIWETDATNDIKNFKTLLDPREKITRPKNISKEIIDFELGFLFNLTSDHFKNGFEFETVKVIHKPSGPQVKKLSLHNRSTHAFLKEVPDDIYVTILGFTDEEIFKHFSSKGHGFYKANSGVWGYLPDEYRIILRKYYLAQLFKLWPYLANHKNIFQLKTGTFSSANIESAQVSSRPIVLSFLVYEDDKFIVIELQCNIGERKYSPDEVTIHLSGILIIDNKFHLSSGIEDLDVMDRFKFGKLKIPVANKFKVITEIIPLLEKNYTVEVPDSYKVQELNSEPGSQIVLKEYNKQYLLIQPQFRYEGITLDYESDPENLIHQLADGSWQTVKRDKPSEKVFIEKLRLLHPLFDRQRQNDFFYLPFADVMKNAWFIKTVRQLQSEDVAVLGMQELKNFRYNPNPPKWEIKAGSNIDWFDLRIKLSFGSQDVPLKDVRRALITRQNIVLLGDGTMGVLPEEWLKKFSLLMQMGEEKDGKLRVSKLHFTLIDELHDQIDNDKIRKDIDEKKQKLLTINDVKTVKLSKKIKASLRPYQQSGFQWLQVLDEMGWGGCLADDMGLGKTLQAISFLQFVKEKYKNSTSLVVCPTSLIYNWEAELKKFAPSLRYHIYYGTDREFSDQHFESYDIIITSYGIVRNDLEHLLKFDWHYVILDESQAIKNPNALTTKAVQLLKSKNRLILSGTPLQNNTYDLYAQFNFINPGLLGTKEFYKEFANGIDKFNDAEKSSQLRKLIYPFMLRRTKEQVAPDLPDKTEMILWCEMPKEQRAVYEEYKNHFKAKLLEKIEEVGMAEAAMYILEGLLRLRQICDSPQLVKSSEKLTDQSIKIDELMREVEENIGQHKILVFSQFTSMLSLIRKRLDLHKHRYAYLDGSTTAENRKKAVDEFQSNPDIKIFLISLKAGGVGLNLTAADYIYLVDPWWNPAVEQQAIDRTHRIGQKNKIFAYRMICKNTVEEKIIDLQKRKKQIANDLVTEDTGFIKKLKKEDIEFLFT